jgi:hypothetical protein
MTHRSIAVIADDIREDWTNVNYAAKPYLEAMHYLMSINSLYGAESADSIILRFLGNASSWRGETAKRIKTELKQILKGN